MPGESFEDAVEKVLEKDARYHADAYVLLRDALDFTLKRIKKEEGTQRHVTGPELCLGFRDHVIRQFGPMALPVCREWGLHSCADIGELVFNLIDVGTFKKTDSDSRADFAGHYGFREAFLDPYLPKAMRENGGDHLEGGAS
jgi:uncharacterized repeat protein (TIGR04138 family)